MYFSPAQARREIEDRQRAGVRELVVDWWKERGFEFPDLPQVSHMAVLARQVATCRFEDVVFREMARAAGLEPVWLEYTADMFVPVSRYKLSLLHPILSDRSNKHGQPIGVKQRLGDATRWSGRPLCDVKTFEGQMLPAYHHNLQRRVLGDVVRHDLSACLKTIGRAAQYYHYYLSLFLAHGVLFEDYHGGESGQVLDRFTADRFEPAWKFLLDEFGMTPVIVSMPWWEGMQFFPTSNELGRYGPVCDRERIQRLVA